MSITPPISLLGTHYILPFIIIIVILIIAAATTTTSTIIIIIIIVIGFPVCFSHQLTIALGDSSFCSSRSLPQISHEVLLCQLASYSINVSYGTNNHQAHIEVVHAYVARCIQLGYR